MTFTQSRFSATLTRAGANLSRQYWVYPIIALGLLTIIGYLIQSSISRTMKSSLSSQLQTLLNVQCSMLENWYAMQQYSVESIASHAEVRKLIDQLTSKYGDSSENKSVPEEVELRSALDRTLMTQLNPREHMGYLVFDQEHRVVASNAQELIGKQYIQQYTDFVSLALDGTPVVSPPFASVIALKDNLGLYHAGTPTMFAVAPVRNDNLKICGAVALRLQPEKEFTRILQIGQMGQSGETYAFNKHGVMVSNSRFDHDLILSGILADHPNSKSILNLQLRDPGADMTRGYRPKQRRSDLPFTKMVEAAIVGRDGVDVEGYRDYRGVWVVGAWKWFPKYAIGIATEIDKAEAFHPLTILSRVFWFLFGLLFLTSFAILVFSILLKRMQREAQKAAIEAQQLGQYRLEQKLGAGAMGIVYRGFHSMMRRPTAIKLLNAELNSGPALARFEREVQITSQLNHPNTIAIYDYGRTPEGVFYYAMEYLDGLDLQMLVDQYGAQREARVIQIMLQICGSLFEAHAQGLVHRDIKPSNIMLNHRGGQPDVVKVLDFGLVKQLDANDPESGLAGTPLYMSPEAIQSPAMVDACSDLYAVGAVGYFLVTGKTVFEANSLVELMQKHVTEIPLKPSERANVVLSEEFEHVLIACLEKSRAKRPQTARDLASRLLNCKPSDSWSLTDAENWWSNHQRRRTTNLEVSRSSLSQTRVLDSSPSTPDSFDFSLNTVSGVNLVPQAKGPSISAAFDQTILQPGNETK